MGSVSTVFAGSRDEIQHLLSYVEDSDCAFERNGKMNDSTAARSHIERKFGYVEKHVDETEDFIKYAATKSRISGRQVIDGTELTVLVQSPVG